VAARYQPAVVRLAAAPGPIMTPTLLDRYLGRRILVSTALVFAVLLAMFMFFTLLEALPDYGVGRFGLYELLRFVALSQPRKIYELFPVATLIGTITGLSMLAASSELVAIRAAGVSATRIVLAALKTGALLIVAALVLGEVIMPVTDNEAQLGRAQALATGLQKKGSGLWLRDESSFVNVGEVLPDLTLLRVTIYRFSDQLRLDEQIFADRATFRSDHWQLDGVRDARVRNSELLVSNEATRTWQSHLTPEMVNMFSVQPEMLSMLQLNRYIDHLKQNGLDTAQYALLMWQKLLLPFTMAVMILLAVPFVFGHVRSGGMSRRIFQGIMLGLGFEMVNYSFGYFGLIYGLPPFAGALLPLALFFALALYLLRQRSR
jgi:lipopolysaccharide export system permease protein